MNTEQALELSNSILWDAVCEELSMWIDRESAKLRTCSEIELNEIQQKIKCFEMVKHIPEIVKDREE